ncbi:hypothetical protein KSP39_PZI007566 [Platanthera zijinensis]|uniref:Coiled-coil SMC6 And NSE5 INteracting (CANIN) domain-containing protein n=1 Tax=Platanthera zijinensis TaxID=2320716 RepID=A0AAP0BNI3_9ASPA
METHSFSTEISGTLRKKVIVLDDLLDDYYTQQREIDSNACKKAKVSKRYSSDEEDEKNEKGNETKLTEMADECEKQVYQITAEHEIPMWGQEIFGQQKSFPLVGIMQLQNCKLFQPSRENELDFDELTSEQGNGETILEELLINGWLSHIAFISGSVEASVASWTFYQAMYCSNDELELSACDFWCRMLLSKNEAGGPSIVLEWVPGFHEVKDVLEFYGYLFDKCQIVGPSSSSTSRESAGEGPPINMRSWIKILSACFQIRQFQSLFSASEAQELLAVIICLFLERQLQGLSFILTECLQSILSFFTEDEWDVSCENVAHSVAYSVPKDHNSLRVVECIFGTNSRSKQLRSRMAVHILGSIFNKNVSDEKGILKSLVSVKVKDKNTDFLTIYIYIILSEIWLLSYDDSGEERVAMLNMWAKFLQICSCDISNTDWRPYASKVRSKASYLLQSSAY